jgi:tetratricopeptide (TPR) repeat protein
MEERLMEAARAYERDRYQDARKLLRRLATDAPAAAAVRELHGLTLYRMGKWSDAAKELEAFRALTGSYDQHPVLADCYRARRRYKKVDELWRELREASPSAEVVTEGRIVAAGALADQGQARAAIELLEHGPATPKRPKLHHIRLWYALADLYERAGELPRARELFRRVADADPDYANAAERLAALG